MAKIEKSDPQWREQLSEEQYRITRKAGTERAGTGPHLNEKREGTYVCVCCGNELFLSDTKYESGSGWPSFYQPVCDEAVSEHVDAKLFMTRTEVRCAECEAHLGHVFEDGPQPTGLRYCMNGNALNFNANEE